MWIVQCLLALLTWVVAIEGQCSISVQDGLPEIEPLILTPGEELEFLYPNKNGILEFSKDEQVRLMCNGKKNYFVNVSDETERSDIIAVCKSDGQFEVLGNTTELKNLGCSKWPVTEQRVAGSCFGSHVKYEIGFGLNDDFIKLIEVCHDPILMTPLYTKFELAKEISGARKAESRRSFIEPLKRSVSYDKQYKRTVQIDMIGNILGSIDEGTKYIKNDAKHYLARGHLAANADFIYNSQKRATFYYINAAPQWQSCNAYNWAYLEKDVRTFASTFDQDLTVYTGVYEIAQLPDKYDVEQDLYLSLTNNGTLSMPVPGFFWKVIYNEKTQLGTAFVEINNPWLDSIPSSYKICGKLIQNTRWDSWSIEHDACSSYTCQVDELRKFIHFPKFTVKGLLV